MSNFVYDETTLPETKTDANPLAGPSYQSVQAEEFNLITSASYDLRQAIRSASFIGFTTASQDEIPGIGSGRVRLSGSTFQAVVGGSGVGYLDILTVLSGNMSLPGSGAFGGSVAAGTSVSAGASLSAGTSLSVGTSAWVNADLFVTGSAQVTGTLSVSQNISSSAGASSFAAVSASQGFWANVNGTQLYVLANGAKGPGVWGIWTQNQDGLADQIMNLRAAGYDLLRLNPSGSSIGNFAAPHNLNIFGPVTASIDVRVSRNLTVVGALTASNVSFNPPVWLTASLVNATGSLYYTLESSRFVTAIGIVSAAWDGTSTAIATLAGFGPASVNGSVVVIQRIGGGGFSSFGLATITSRNGAPASQLSVSAAPGAGNMNIYIRWPYD